MNETLTNSVQKIRSKWLGVEKEEEEGKRYDQVRLSMKKYLKEAAVRSIAVMQQFGRIME